VKAKTSAAEMMDMIRINELFEVIIFKVKFGIIVLILVNKSGMSAQKY
jgi:hypothetical protein